MLYFFTNIKIINQVEFLNPCVALLALRQQRAVAPLEPHPQNPVVVLLLHAQEVAVVLAQDDGGGARGVVDQGQLPEVVALVQSAHHTLRSATRGTVTQQTLSSGPERCRCGCLPVRREHPPFHR